MEIDDRRAMAALLTTARDILQRRVQPELAGEPRLDAAMIANAIGLVVRALASPGTAWSDQRVAPVGEPAARVRLLRAQVRARLQVTNPGYIAEVEDAPP